MGEQGSFDPYRLEQLTASSEESMRRLASRMLSRFPSVRRWEETDDVYQEAAVRLHRALHEVVPESVRHFHSLAALQIRRVLIDMARRYSRPHCFAANHDTNCGGPERWLNEEVDGGGQPEAISLDDWADFHRLVEDLPEPLREVFDLLWYSGLRQEEAAELLGITVRSLERRWRNARILLSDWCRGERPVSRDHKTTLKPR